MKRLIWLGAASLLIGGCADASGQPAPSPAATTVTLTVTTSQQPGSDGARYTEGALPQVMLIASDDNVFASSGRPLPAQ